MASANDGARGRAGQEEIRRRIAAALAAAGDYRTPVQVPAQLCQVCVEVLPVSGASVSLSDYSRMARTTWCASDDTAARLAEAQYTLGDGPCHSALALAAPVFAPDLAQAPDAQRWPFFARQAVELGVRAVFSLPLGGPQPHWDARSVSGGARPPYGRRPGGGAAGPGRARVRPVRARLGAGRGSRRRSSVMVGCCGSRPRRGPSGGRYGHGSVECRPPAGSGPVAGARFRRGSDGNRSGPGRRRPRTAPVRRGRWGRPGGQRPGWRGAA